MYDRQSSGQYKLEKYASDSLMITVINLKRYELVFGCLLTDIIR